MITNKQFEEFLARGHELPGVEFKGPGSRGDDYLRAKVVRAIIGMTNRRDGGIVIIGVEERNGNLNPSGLSQNDLRTWKNYDHVTTAFANYMNPPANFELSVCQFEEKEFIVFEVHEFADIPTICKKGYSKAHSAGYSEVVLREGACYIRSRHKPETVEISSVEHMRDLLDLAVEKGVRKFVTQAQKAGMSFLEDNGPDDEELFRQQIEGWDSELKKKIQRRGYWKVIIRPTKFVEECIPEILTLYPLIQKTAVSIRGLSFPYTSGGLEYQMDNNWVGQEYEWDWVREVWRFYQSGQFAHISGLLEDWHDESKWNPAQEGWQPGHILSVEGVVYHLTEVFEFAARLSLAHEYIFDERVFIEVELSNLKGRKLTLSPSRWLPLPEWYDAHANTIPLGRAYLKEEVIAAPRELALEQAMKIFHRFKWDPSKETLQDIQSRIGRFI